MSAIDKLPVIASVTPVFNAREMTLSFIRQLLDQNYPHLKIIIVDDASTDGTAEAIGTQFPQVILLHGDGNLWWTKATNLGVERALSLGIDFILTINNDATLVTGYLQQLAMTGQKNSGQIIGSRIHDLQDKQKIWSIGSYLRFGKLNFFDGHFGNQQARDVEPHLPASPMPVQMCSGNGTLVPAEVFHRVGLYDAVNHPHYHADSELCLRAGRAGIQTLIDLEAILYNDFTYTGGFTTVSEMLFSLKSPYRFRSHWHIIRYSSLPEPLKLLLSIWISWLYFYEALPLVPISLWRWIKNSRR